MEDDRGTKIPRFRLTLPAGASNAVSATLSSGQLALGGQVGELEKILADYFKCLDVVTTSSGFSALHLAIEATVGRAGKEVLVPACSTCFAVVNAVLASGNVPVLYDIDLTSFSFDLSDMKQRITSKTAAAIIVPHFGIPCDVEKLQAETDLPLIIDAAQSLLSAADYLMPLPAITTFSCYPTKGLIGIDGGFIACMEKARSQKIRELRYYGDQKQVDGIAHYNYKLNNINAALALCGFGEIDKIRQRRHEIQRAYTNALTGHKDLLAWLPALDLPPLQKYVLLFASEQVAQNFAKAMHRRDIGVSSELVLLDKRKDFPNSSFAPSRLVSLPFYEGLSDTEVAYVCQTADEILKNIRP